jgi:hypothetical protein
LCKEDNPEGEEKERFMEDLGILAEHAIEILDVISVDEVEKEQQEQHKQVLDGDGEPKEDDGEVGAASSGYYTDESENL